MLPATFSRTCERIRDHCLAHDKRTFSIIFHGGEPLLGGVEHLRTLLQISESIFGPANLTFHVGMQSNGLLFSADIGDLLLAHNVKIGISIDGPPSVNDINRIDHVGRGSSQALESQLKLLTSAQFRSLFSGFLIVVSLTADPEDVLDYVLQFQPPSIDFLLPYDNWDRRPPGKPHFESTPYGDWLIRAFQYWYEKHSTTRVRQFASIMRLALGGNSLVETMGLGPTDLVVIETNGDMEGLDSLKGTYNGATVLGLNVFDHDLDAAASHMAIRSRQIGAAGLCRTCQDCPIVGICGGGYLPNRYSEANGFQNASFFCRDLDKLIRHIHGRVEAELLTAFQGTTGRR